MWAAVVLWPAALARFLSIWEDLLPRIPPPHWRRCSSNLSELQKGMVSKDLVQKRGEQHTS